MSPGPNWQVNSETVARSSMLPVWISEIFNAILFRFSLIFSLPGNASGARFIAFELQFLNQREIIARLLLVLFISRIEK